jgi:hypothetical protein
VGPLAPIHDRVRLTSLDVQAAVSVAWSAAALAWASSGVAFLTAWESEGLQASSLRSAISRPAGSSSSSSRCSIRFAAPKLSAAPVAAGLAPATPYEVITSVCDGHLVY